MSFLKTLFSMITMLSLLLVSGCSDLFQDDVVDKKLQSDKFKANCELNVDEFSLIMEEDISPAIDCMGKNLKLFMDVAESKKPGYLSRVGLENYLKRNRKDIKPEVIRALRSIFDINFLVYGEDRDFISRANLDALINFAKLFNEKASSNFQPIFMDENTIDYDNYRFQRDQRIKPAALVISSGLKSIFRPDRKGETHSLNLITLLDAFTNENNERDIADVKKLLFIKKILLGGDKETITHKELSVLIDNFSSYVLIALDGMRYKDIRLNQESTVQLLSSDLTLLNNLIFSSSIPGRTSQASLEREDFFNLREAIDAVDMFVKDEDLDLSKYYDLIKEAKRIVMEGTNSEVVTAADLKRAFAHGFNILKTGTLFHRFWATERALLEARPGKPINHQFDDLKVVFKEELPRVNDFIRILTKYRFMRGENLSAFYTDDYMRNANAVYEIAIYEYVLKLAMREYGCPRNDLGIPGLCDAKLEPEHAHLGKDYVYMKKDHVVNLIKKFRTVMIENDLILPGREVKTAETITLLGSLFQYQSDKNKVFDINEATEFAISLFTAIDISDDMMNHFIKLNKKDPKKCEMDEYGRVAPNCYRDNFFESLCFNYPDQFPKLFSSMGATVYESDPARPSVKKLVCKIPHDAPNLAYLDRVEKAARNCHEFNDKTEIPYAKGDFMNMILAMMHIETTIIRWDVRTFNNKMDAAEVMDAYEIYSPALDGFLETMPSLVKKMKKQIFQYLVKYEKVPDPKDFGSIWKFAKFLVSFNKDVSANRKTIASILVTIGEQGTKSKFDCELLRNLPIDPNYDPEAAPNSTPAPVAAPTKLTAEDLRIAQDIESQSDSWIKLFLNDFWPSLFSF